MGELNVSVKQNHIMHEYYYMFGYVITSLEKYLTKSYHRINASSVLETDKNILIQDRL
jgi:hypothetical protein